MTELSDTHREVLTALCDTVVPAVARPEDPDGFFARRASDVGVPQALEAMLAGMPEDQRGGLLELLDALGGHGLPGLGPDAADGLLQAVAAGGPEAAAGIGALTSLTLFLHYGLPDERGQNPNWATFGYPGPVTPPSQVPKPLQPLEPAGDTTLEADVCIVGSGAGGGVVAGELAARGLHVVVLEAGGYLDDADFTQLELPAYQRSYWRGGPTPTGDQNLTLQAGACLGGGTTINWTNALRPRPWVREQWEREFGLDGLAGAAFERHLDAVWTRLGVTGRCSELNGPQERMRAGAQALGWSFRHTDRNVREDRYAFDTAGYIGFGDATGAKQSTVKTYLQDAAGRGAVLVTRCWADRVLVAGGRAAGVEATWSDPETGRAAAITVRAPQVVVAAGALESPALLLRSRLGGPATGDHLRLHPCTATVGYYAEDTEAWRGAPHAGLVDEFARAEDDHGFLVEGAQYTTAVAGSAVPYTSGAEHKALMSRFRHGASLIALLRDRGHGRVTVDHAGAAVPWYALTDEVDLRNARLGIEAQARLHEAAGAEEILALASGAPRWRRGEPLEPFVARSQAIGLQAGGWKLFSAHQMGTCRMGTDPRTSFAGPWGELHDTPGVWIGDASAFPTASGTNPMITVMALAHRTAEAIAAAAPSGSGTAVGAASGGTRP